MLSFLDRAGTTPPSSPGGISVPVAIVLGLVASFVQSLGLTIQRKAHVQNETLPLERRRKSEWRDPLWLFGFVIFIASNIGGTVFQIGALPIVMLAPLGAVSLLYNALLARFILNDFLSYFMVIGTALIAAGAVLIGYFGVVPEKPHSLDELLGLYARPAFVAFASVAFLVFAGVLSLAHLTEWQLEASIKRDAAAETDPTLKRKRSLRRRWSAPNLATVAEVSETLSGIATPILDIVDEAARRGLPADRLIAAARNASPQRLTPTPSTSYGTLPRNARLDYGAMADSSPIDNITASPATPKMKVKPPSLMRTESANASTLVTVRRTRLGLSVAYGGASGSLSGVCLLLAKSGVELLVLTFSGDNQFLRWQSWMLVGVMLIAALLQLWYLNKSLKLSDPTLVCPLAFCFYNTSSIVLGLVYFNQLGSLAWYDLVLVAVGTCVLLTGVWVVSLHGSSGAEEEDADADADADAASMLETGETAPTAILEAENTTETEALLSNVAGIGGPHLPPAGPASSASPTSPSTTLVHRGSRRSSRSGSISSLRGLGINAAGLRIDDSSSSTNSTLATADTGRSARHALYTSFLERGLSIGISPSSPGFYLPPPPSSPSDERTTLSSRERRSRRLARRTFSEADVPSTNQDALGGSALEDDDEVNDGAARTRGSSAFGLNFRLDSEGLRTRLTSLRKSQRRWLPWRAGKSVPEDEETGEVEARDAETQPLLSGPAG